MITIILPALAALWLLCFGPIKDGLNWYGRICNRVRIWQKRKRLRPFDCVKCMAGWIALPWAYFTDPVTHNQPYLLPVYMLGGMVTGAILEKIWNA